MRFRSFLGTPWCLPIIQSIGDGGRVFTHSSPVQLPPPGRPDFAALYGTYDRTGEPRLTPRTASALYTALWVLADGAHLDADDHEDEPILRRHTGEWRVLDRLPRTSWRQDGSWRRRVGDAGRELGETLGNGRQIRPTCIVEDLLLRLAIEDAEDEAAEAAGDPAHPSHALPEHLDDYLWDLDALVLLDSDVRVLDAPRLRGSADWISPSGSSLSRGQLDPGHWFDPL